MELTINEMDTIIEKILGIYRTILKQHAQNRDGNILQQDEIFKNLDDVIDFMFKIRRRDTNMREGFEDDKLEDAIEMFDKQTKSEITKMNKIIQNYYKKVP